MEAWWECWVALQTFEYSKVVGDRHHQITLDCDESSFCQLEVFKMEKMQVVHCSMGKGEMPRLQRLIIECGEFFLCPLKNNVGWLPFGMWKFYILVQHWQRWFNSCRIRWGMDVSSKSFHLSTQLTERVEVERLHLLCYALAGGRVLRGVNVPLFRPLVHILLAWYAVYLLLFLHP